MQRDKAELCRHCVMVVLCLHVAFNVGDTAAAAADKPRLLFHVVVLTMLSEMAALRSQVAYNALSAGVKAQLPLPPMSPDSAMPASSEPAAIPAARPFDPAQVASSSNQEIFSARLLLCHPCCLVYLHRPRLQGAACKESTKQHWFQLTFGTIQFLVGGNEVVAQSHSACRSYLAFIGQGKWHWRSPGQGGARAACRLLCGLMSLHDADRLLLSEPFAGQTLRRFVVPCRS